MWRIQCCKPATRFQEKKKVFEYKKSFKVRMFAEIELEAIKKDPKYKGMVFDIIWRDTDLPSMSKSDIVNKVNTFVSDLGLDGVIVRAEDEKRFIGRVVGNDDFICYLQWNSIGNFFKDGKEVFFDNVLAKVLDFVFCVEAK